MRRLCGLLVLVGFLSPAVLLPPVAAADPHTQNRKSPVRFGLAPLVGRPRSQAPQTIDLVLDNQDDRILEGDLQLKIFVGRRQVQDWRSGPLAVSPALQRVRTMLPPITVHHDQNPVTVMARFVGEGFDLDLGEIDLVVPAYWKRSFVLGIVQPEERRAARDDMIGAQALAVDRFDANGSSRIDLVTYPTPILPEDVPVTGGIL